jgi:hypothetical protein
MDAGPPSDDRQIGRQAAVAAKLPKNAVVIGDDLEEDLRTNILDILRAEGRAADVGGVVNDVIDQAEEAINKVVPGPRFVVQAALQQSAVLG